MKVKFEIFIGFLEGNVYYVVRGMKKGDENLLVINLKLRVEFIVEGYGWL